MRVASSRRVVRIVLATTITVGLADLVAAPAAAQQATADEAAGTAAVTLPPIDAIGAGETATGHVNGYVATRSATGTKTDTPIIETPQSISVVTSDQMKAMNAASLAEAFAYTPGILSMSPAYSNYTDDFTVRGFNIANGNLGMLRDGMKLQSNVYDGGQEPYGLERLELLRGPSSILYGASSPGGVINAVSKMPGADPYHELNLSYGSYDRFQASGDATGPLTSDGKLTYRLTGLYRDSDTWVHHMNDDKIYAAPAITWKPTAATTLTLYGSYQQIRSQFSAPMPYDDLRHHRIGRKLFIGEPDFDRYDSDVYTIGYMFEHRFDDRLTIRNKLRYYDAKVKWDYLQYGALYGDTLYRGVSYRREHSTGITTDTSAQYKFGMGPVEHTAILGVDTYNSTYRNHRYSGDLSTLDIADPNYGSDVVVNKTTDRGQRTRNNQVGLYLQDQLKLDHWNLLLSGRHDWADSRTISRQTGARTDTYDMAFTGRAGLLYLFDNGFAPYVSYSQSFSPTTGSTDRQGNVFKPTTGIQYEAGLRYEPPGRNLLLSGAIYQLTQKNVLTPDPEDTSYSVQTGKVRSRGVELEAKVRLGELNLAASYAYTDARTRKSNTESEIGERVDLVPYNTVGLWADRGFDDLGIRGLRLGAGVQYLGSMNVSDQHRDVPGYALVNAMASYDLGVLLPQLDGMVFSVNAENLFDKKYMTCAGSSGCRYGAPLQVAGTVSYRW